MVKFLILMSYKINYTLFFFIVIFIGCKKKSICLPGQIDNSIIELDWQEPICPGAFDEQTTGNEEIIHLGNQFSSPAFNPNNPYEFCYYQVVADSGSQIELNHQIVIFNFQTGEKTVVANNTKHVWGNLAWNKNGWIAYQNEVGRVFATNITTQETIQMSIAGNVTDKNLAWLNNGDTLTWGYLNLNAYPFFKSRSIHETDVNDLINGSPTVISNEYSISSDNNILTRINSNFVTGTTFSIAHFDQAQSYGNQFTLPLYGSGYGRVNWHIDGEHFYTPHLSTLEDAGLFEVNIETMNMERVYNFCDKQLINQAVSSPNGNFLIIEKTVREHIINDPGAVIPILNQIVENKKLWLYNLNTKKEAPLPLD